jgi:hypothetical protein
MKRKLLFACPLLVLLGLWIFGHAAVKPGATARPQATTKEAAAPQVYDVVSPVGKTTIKQITQASRLNTLAGKTIGLASNGSFKSWVTMPLIQKLLAEKYPTAKFVPYTELPAAQTYPAPGTTTKTLDAFRAAVKEKHIDAIITGNGG